MVRDSLLSRLRISNLGSPGPGSLPGKACRLPSAHSERAYLASVLQCPVRLHGGPGTGDQDWTGHTDFQSSEAGRRSTGTPSLTTKFLPLPTLIVPPSRRPLFFPLAAACQNSTCGLKVSTPIFPREELSATVSSTSITGTSTATPTGANCWAAGSVERTGAQAWANYCSAREIGCGQLSAPEGKLAIHPGRRHSDGRGSAWRLLAAPKSSYFHHIAVRALAVSGDSIQSERNISATIEISYSPRNYLDGPRMGTGSLGPGTGRECKSNQRVTIPNGCSFILSGCS